MSYSYVLKHRAKRKEEIVYVMGEECQICGYNRCIKALECHHIDPEEKDIDFGNLCKNWENLVEELKKCILVCANCHREIHDNIEKYRDLSSSFNKERANEVSQKIDDLKNHKTYYCKNCGIIITRGAKMCTKCRYISTRKVERPSYEELKQDISKMSMCAVGRKYGVSDNAIRKWLKQYEKNGGLVQK